MSRKTIAGASLATLVAVVIGQLLSSADAAAGFPGKNILDQTGCCRRCPACDHVCKLDAEQVEEEKSCFEVESKVICIPRVVFPWQKKKCNACDACDGQGCNNCVHNGARTRKICVLVTDKYKCPSCQYTWSAEKKPCAAPSPSCCDSGCDAPGCDAVGPVMSLVPAVDGDVKVVAPKTGDVEAKAANSP